MHAIETGRRRTQAPDISIRSPGSASPPQLSSASFAGQAQALAKMMVDPASSLTAREVVAILKHLDEYPVRRVALQALTSEGSAPVLREEKVRALVIQALGRYAPEDMLCTNTILAQLEKFPNSRVVARAVSRVIGPRADLCSEEVRACCMRLILSPEKTSASLDVACALLSRLGRKEDQLRIADELKERYLEGGPAAGLFKAAEYMLSSEVVLKAVKQIAAQAVRHRFLHYCPSGLAAASVVFALAGGMGALGGAPHFPLELGLATGLVSAAAVFVAGWLLPHPYADRDDYVKKAISLLRKTNRDPDFERVLLKTAANEKNSWEVREAAATALNRNPLEEGINEIVRLIRSRNSDTVMIGFKAAAGTRDDRIREAVAALFGDSRPGVAMAAYKTMEDL